MELPANDIIKKGFVKFKGKMTWQQQWIILKKPTSKAGVRLERFADERTLQTAKYSTIDLESVSYIRQEKTHSKFIVNIVFKDGSKPVRIFSCDTFGEARDWTSALHETCVDSEGKMPTVMNTMDLLRCGPSQKELTEVFSVFLLKSLPLPFYGECLLQVTQEQLHLLEYNNPSKRLATWPLNTLRRYGSDNNATFTFESGRFCETGEGIFIVSSQQAQLIYHKIHAATVAIAEINHVQHRQSANRADLDFPPQDFPGSGELSPSGNSAVHSPLPKPPPSQGQLSPGSFKLLRDMGDIPQEVTPSPTSDGYMSMTEGFEQSDYLTLKAFQWPLPPPPPPPPPTPPTVAYENQGKGARGSAPIPPDGATNVDMDIYEEKGLTPAFKMFLRERKQ